MKKLLGFLFLFFSLNLSAYQIKVQINNCEDSIVYLGHYYGAKTYVVDTAFSKKNVFVFKGKEPLKTGLYFIYFSNSKSFELIIDGEQEINLQTDVVDLIGKMKVKKSKKNQRFYDYVQFTSQISNALNDSLDKGVNGQKMVLETQKAINEKIKSYIQDYSSKYPSDLLTYIFKASTEVEVPDSISKLDEGTGKKANAFNYYKSHFWDAVFLEDARLLRTQVFHQRFVLYMQDLTLDKADELIASADYLVEKTKHNPDLFEHVVSWITSKYQKPTKMGNDAVFVHMVEKYYTNDQVDWLDSTSIYRLNARAKEMKLSLIGKPAQALKLPDTAQIYRSLYDLKSDYVFLFFYSASCGRCKKKIPLYKSVYEKYKSKGIEAYAVCSSIEIPEWKAFIKEHKIEDWINVIDLNFESQFRKKYDVYSVPLVYILDKNKTIIAKQLQPEQLERFFEMTFE